MKRVWAITRGSYSDYQVCAIFESGADAQRALAEAERTGEEVWNRPDAVTSFVLYAKGETPKQLQVHKRFVTIWDNGTVDGRGPFDCDPAPINEASRSVDVVWDWSDDVPKGKRPSVRFVRAPIHKGKGGRLEIVGTDEQAVDQSLSDNLSRILANVEGTGKATL